MLVINLLYLINFNHLSLSFKQRTDYIERYLSQILDATIIPSTIAICAEDLLLLKTWNKATFIKLVNHPNIKFVLTPYSHALPHLSPSSFVENVMLGEKIIKKLIPKQKILHIGCSPEIDLPDPKLFLQIQSIWPSIIIGESQINVRQIHKDSIPEIFLLNRLNSTKKVVCFLSRRWINYRRLLHEYYRGECSKENLFQGIIEDFNKYNKPVSMVLRIDLEVLIFNKPNATSNLDLQIKQYLNFQQTLLAKDVHFDYIVDTIIPSSNCLIRYSNSQVIASEEENYRWQKTPFLEQINKLYSNTKITMKKIMSLSLMCSDYYCTDCKDLKFKNSKGETLTIIQSKKYRAIEKDFKTKLLELKSPSLLFDKFQDKDLKKYFKYFLKTINLAQNQLTTKLL